MWSRYSNHEAPTQQCLERVKRDLAEFHADPPPGVFMAADENDITTVHAIVTGAPGTSYEGGFFHLLFKCTNRYPMSPPMVRFMTTDGGRARFSPHISSGGHICLSLLGTMAGPRWTPAHNLSALAVSIQSMLDDDINCVDSAWEHILLGYWGKGNSKNIRYQTLTVAVCGTIESCLEDGCPFPPILRDQLLDKFLENFENYEKMTMKELAESKGGLLSWIAIENKYETLVARLRKLKVRVEKRNGSRTVAAAS